MLAIKDLKSKSNKELKDLSKELKEELFVLRFQQATGQLAEPHRINVVKKDIAKVLTVININEPNLKGNLSRIAERYYSTKDVKEKEAIIKLAKEIYSQQDYEKLTNALGLTNVKPGEPKTTKKVSNTKIVEPIKTEEVKVEEPKVEEVKAEEPKVEEVKTEATETDEVKTNEG